MVSVWCHELSCDVGPDINEAKAMHEEVGRPYSGIMSLAPNATHGMKTVAIREAAAQPINESVY